MRTNTRKPRYTTQLPDDLLVAFDVALEKGAPIAELVAKWVKRKKLDYATFAVIYQDLATLSEKTRGGYTKLQPIWKALLAASQATDTDQLAELFGLQSWASIDENSSIEHPDEEMTEDEWLEYEDGIRTEWYREWESAVQRVAGRAFHHVHLDLTPVLPDAHFQLWIGPTMSHTWQDAAMGILSIINGVGMFEYASVKDFINGTSSADAREVVLTHLHHLKDYFQVFEGTSPRSVYDRLVR